MDIETWQRGHHCRDAIHRVRRGALPNDVAQFTMGFRCALFGHWVTLLTLEIPLRLLRSLAEWWEDRSGKKTDGRRRTHRDVVTLVVPPPIMSPVPTMRAHHSARPTVGGRSGTSIKFVSIRAHSWGKASGATNWFSTI